MASGGDARERRVLLLTPTQRDGELSRAMLAEAGIDSRLCRDLPALLAELEAPAGAVMLPEEALAEGGMEALRRWTEAQPPWSDLPLIVLVRGGANSGLAEAATRSLGNVTLPSSARWRASSPRPRCASDAGWRRCSTTTCSSSSSPRG